MHFGFAWRRDRTLLGDVFAHAVYEHQSWFGAGTYFNEIPGAGATSPNLRRDDHDVAFMGFGVAIGFER